LTTSAPRGALGGGRSERAAAAAAAAAVDASAGAGGPPAPGGVAIAYPTVDAFAVAVDVAYRPGVPAAAAAATPALWGLTLNALLRLVGVVAAAAAAAGAPGGGGRGGDVLYAGHALAPPVAVDHPAVGALLWRLPHAVAAWLLGLQ